MMQADLLAQIIAQHKFDIDALLDSPDHMRCTCGQSWPNADYSDAVWNLHVANAILGVLNPPPQVEVITQPVPLWALEDEYDIEHEEK